MYILSVWVVLVALIHSGLSVNSEDTDLNSLSSNYDLVGENAENFEVGLVQIDKLSILSIEEICKDLQKLIYVRQDDITISCKDLFNEEISEDLNRVRREADEVEGSGGNEEVTTTETSSTETTTEERTSEATIPEETTSEETTFETTTPEPVIVPKEVTTEKIEENEEQKNETVGIKPVAVEGATVVEIKSEEPTEQPKEESKEEPKEESKEEPKIVEEPYQEVPKEEPTIENFDKDPKKDVETVKGRTLIDSPEKEETKEQSHGEHDGSVQESTAPTKAGSKDTTILIVLFVAVVVVGVLAFAYNFIKKKRQQSADLERVERNSSSIKRSLQNLTKPEGGEAEKKPLIGESKEVEMVNMKKQEEPKENGESAVKS